MKTYPRTYGGLWILIAAAIIVESTAAIQYFYCRSALQHEAEHRAKAELSRAELEINTIAAEVVMSAKAMALIAEKNLSSPDKMFDITRDMVSQTPNMTGAGFTFQADYYKEKGRWFEPYSCEVQSGDKTKLRSEQIGGENHDYLSAEWYLKGLEADTIHWSNPYYDEAGAKTMLVTCTCPVKDKNGQTVALAGADVSLSRLKYIAEYLQVYPESYYSITSANGLSIIPLPDLSDKKDYHIYNEYIDATGWSMTIVVPDSVIFAELQRIGLLVTVLMIIGLLVLVFIIYLTAKDLVRVVNLNNQKERMESELSIARNIQMAMLPTRFPPFEDYSGLNAFGIVVPAKEVGGDLFDFFIREDKLFFCIGDVSGKGVPASLVMAVTRSLFRSFSSYIDNPAQIVSQMNESLSGEGNDQNMFVTLWLGILDLHSGKLQYCNAGHDAPIKIKCENDETGNVLPETLDCNANLPMGVLSGFTYTTQSAVLSEGDTLFLFTDGLTEAENSKHEQFGKERVLKVMKEWKNDMTSQQQIDEMQTEVKKFVGTAEQSDDLTMLSVRYLKQCDNHLQTAVERKRHSLVMRNDIQQIPTLAEWIESLGLPQTLEMPINLALEEAVSNVMLYAYPKDKAGQVLVEAEKDRNQIVFTITDSGIPFDPTQQKEPDITLPAEERNIGGLGIFLVRQIMDSVQYERKDNKNILTLSKKL